MNRLTLQEVEEGAIRCPLLMSNSYAAQLLDNKGIDADSCVGTRCAAWQWCTEEDAEGYTSETSRTIHLEGQLNHVEAQLAAEAAKKGFEHKFQLHCPGPCAPYSCDGCDAFVGDGWRATFFRTRIISHKKRKGFCGMVPANCKG